MGPFQRTQKRICMELSKVLQPLLFTVLHPANCFLQEIRLVYIRLIYIWDWSFLYVLPIQINIVNTRFEPLGWRKR